MNYPNLRKKIPTKHFYLKNNNMKVYWSQKIIGE